MSHCLRFDARHNVLLVAFTGRISQTAYLAAYEDVAVFITGHGPCSCIADFSATDSVDVSPDFAHKIGLVLPAVIPTGMRRVVVAPQPVIYGTARRVASLRKGTGTEVVVTKSLEKALAKFGTDDFDFEELNSPSIG